MGKGGGECYEIARAAVPVPLFINFVQKVNYNYGFGCSNRISYCSHVLPYIKYFHFLYETRGNSCMLLVPSPSRPAASHTRPMYGGNSFRELARPQISD